MNVNGKKQGESRRKRRQEQTSPCGGDRARRRNAAGDPIPSVAANGAMHLSEDQFRAAMYHSGIGMAVVALDGRYLEVNPAFCAIVGYSREELLARDFQSITHPEDLEADLQFVRRMLRREIVNYQMDKRYLHKQGHAIWIQLNVELVWKEDGQPAYFVSQVQDITGRKQAEEKLAAEQSLLSNLMTTTCDVIYFKDRESRFIRVNDAFARRQGLSDPGLLLGKTDFDLFGKHARQAYEDEQRIMATGEPIIDKEEQEDWKDGRITWVSSTKMPLRDNTGKIIGIMGISRDITGRKLAEEALRQAHNNLEKRVAERTAELSQERRLLCTLIDNLPDGVYTKDTAGRKTMVNPADLKVLGCQTKAEAIGKSDFDFFPKEIAEKCWADDQKVLKGEPVINREEFILDKQGRKRWFLSSKLPLRDQNGAIAGLVGISRNITERKQAEEALRQSHDELEKRVTERTAELSRERLQLRTLIDNLPDMIFVKDPRSRFIVVNTACAQQLGASRPEEVLGKSDGDFVAPKLAAQYMADEQVLMQSGQMLHKEERTQHKTLGEMRWSLTTKIPLKDAAGNVVGLMGIARDITERKQIEQALNEHMQQLGEVLDFNKKIIHEASIGITAFKATGECVLANEFAAQALNGTVPDLLKMNFRQLASWRNSDMLKVAEETLATGRPQHCESHFISSFGKEIWQYCHFTKFTRGNEPHLLVLFDDVTHAKQAEAHIREQAALLDKAQDAIMALDMDDRIIYWNKGAERIYGWTATEAVGKKPLELFLNDIVSPHHQKAIQAVNERGEWAGELQEYTKDGKSVTVYARCNVIRDDQGRPKSRLIINTDITERKKLESQFLRSQRMESIGALAGGIAHDLNNILTPLLVSVQVLKEKITDDDGKTLLEALETNVQRGAGLVKQVLAFGRGMGGERIAVNPKHIAREIKQIVRETFPKSVEFEFHSAPGLWTITGDPTQLHQVLLNLCVNARDAMPNGGKLSLGMENVTFDEVYVGMNPEAKAGPYVVITVADTGMGMSREVQNKIFDPFFTTKELGKGTGLGLSTTLTIVKGHGGFIHCNSVPGKGTTFEVYLSANPAALAAESSVAAETSRLPRGHNELVLVVDDEETIRKLAKRTLERFGYRVLLAADGAEAVALYANQQQEIAAIITDMVMPVMDGPATIVALKAMNSDVKIISCSGHTSEGGVAKATNAGIRHFIPKPYTAETVLNALHEVLQTSHEK